MKKLFETEMKPLNNGVALLMGRMAISLLMLAHGLPKMEMLFSAELSNSLLYSVSVQNSP